MEMKFEKMEAKREKHQLKLAEKRKKKIEADLVKKMMKNPNLNPGYSYPMSTKIMDITQAIRKYKETWLELDLLNINDVKEKFVRSIDVENMCAEAKKEICTKVEESMRAELKLLRISLKKDYDLENAQMPENFKEKNKYKKKKRKPRNQASLNLDDIKEKMEICPSFGLGDSFSLVGEVRGTNAWL
ncbi:unnamed protein product [Leptidea sinapis]|uniref:Uncharacterized protein n=1 Tax=Leptidea sinapis TaxID=189913 RepID=A0A5E4PTT6_9NEOP|nr:unnamed protein product [Leptidea sinapis]